MEMRNVALATKISLNCFTFYFSLNFFKQGKCLPLWF